MPSRENPRREPGQEEGDAGSTTDRLSRVEDAAVPSEEDWSLRERPTVSLRAKIVLSFSLFFLLSAVVTLWSIWMVSNLEHRIRFLEVAGNFMMEIQQARRFEKNFLLYGTNHPDAMGHLRNAEAILDRHSETMGKVMGKERFATVSKLLSDYHKQLSDLQQLPDGTERNEVVSTLRSDGATMVSFGEEFVAREREKVDRHLYLARRIPFLFLGGLLLIMVFVGTWLTRQLLVALNRFMAYTERISQGDFSPIKPVRRYRDEFSKLAEAFNRMTRELSRRHDILVESHKLRAVGNLVAGVAHELNNPLNNTMLSAVSLQEDWDTLSDREKLEIVGDVVSETERSKRIVHDLLDFARESEARVRPLDISKIIDESVRLVANQARMAKVAVEKAFDAELPHVHGDARMLKQVFVNLMLNAIDALPQGGRVRIAVRKAAKEGFLSVEVSDNGPGIPEHVQQSVFEPFFTTKGPGKGTGLGLSVSRGIVRKLGGYIRFESRPGEGTVFTVSLPVTGAPSDVMSRGGS